jgi:protein SCO1/2
MIRTPAAIVPYLVAAAMIIAGVLWHEADQIGGLGRTVTTGTATIGGPFSLIDQNGRTRTQDDFRGRFMMIYFGYSYCPDICPTTLAEMAAALDKLGSHRNRIVPLFISIDPERDTPQVLKAYMKAFGADFTALTGSTGNIEKAAKAYRVYIRKHPLADGNYSMDHSGVIYLMGPDGRFVTYYENEIGPDKIAEDLRRRV